MFIYRGGQTVQKGMYWEPDKGTKIVVNDSGLLPGDRNETYFRFPESYLLVPILLLGLGLSMALPYGAGFLLFFVLLAVGGACYVAGSSCVRIMKEMLGRNAVFGYAPTTAYMTGAKTKKKKADGSLTEEKKDTE
jgi:hypothetical protein